MKSIPVAVCFLEHDGRIALWKFKRNHLVGYWGLPGGKFEPGEWLPEAAEREMQDEVQVPVRFQSYDGVVDEIIVPRDQDAFRVILYICRVSTDDPQGYRTIENEEGIVQWFTREEISGMEANFVPSDWRILQGVLNGTLNGYYRCQQTMTENGPRVDFYEPV